VISPTHSRAFPLLSTLRHLESAKSLRISSRLATSPVASRHQTHISVPQITREGALNIVRQAVAAGVKRISFAGTVATILDFTNLLIKAPLSDKDWNPLKEETAVIRDYARRTSQRTSWTDFLNFSNFSTSLLGLLRVETKDHRRRDIINASYFIKVFERTTTA